MHAIRKRACGFVRLTSDAIRSTAASVKGTSASSAFGQIRARSSPACLHAYLWRTMRQACVKWTAWTNHPNMYKSHLVNTSHRRPH